MVWVAILLYRRGALKKPSFELLFLEVSIHSDIGVRLMSENWDKNPQILG